MRAVKQILGNTLNWIGGFMIGFSFPFGPKGIFLDSSLQEFAIAVPVGILLIGLGLYFKFGDSDACC